MDDILNLEGDELEDAEPEIKREKREKMSVPICKFMGLALMFASWAMPYLYLAPGLFSYCVPYIWFTQFWGLANLIVVVASVVIY